jgi:hypothetical protein
MKGDGKEGLKGLTRVGGRPERGREGRGRAQLAARELDASRKRMMSRLEKEEAAASMQDMLSGEGN